MLRTQWIRNGGRAAAVGVAITIASVAGAEERVRYDDWKAVEVETNSAADFAVARKLGLRLLSCHEHLGGTSYLVAPDQLAALEASGLTWAITDDNVQATLDDFDQKVEAAAAADGASFYDTYHEFDDLIARFQGMALLNPQLVSGEDVGDSLQGRDIWAYRISGPGGDPKPAVLINGCQHAREWVSPATVTYIAERLVTEYGSDPEVTELMDALEFIIVPVVNPDGYQFSWDVNRLWRKNRRDNGDGTIGVDLNRNWAEGWGGGGSSGDGNEEIYRGTAPFSEPESQAMRDLYDANPHIIASIDFHSFGQDVLYPYGYQGGGPNDDGLHGTVGASMRSAIESVHGLTYSLGPIFETLYQASGGSVDWTWAAHDVLSYTIELRDTGAEGFVLSPEFILPTAEENFPAVLELARAVALGAQFDAAVPFGVQANAANDVSVSIVTLPGLSIDTATARVLSRVGDTGPFTEMPMVFEGGASYAAPLVMAPCGTEIEFYFEVESTDGVVYQDPADPLADPYRVPVFEITEVFADDFESDNGWSVENVAITGGGFERGVPAGGGDRGDPIVDGDGSGSCYLTENAPGNTDVDGGPTRMTSPQIDCTALDGAQLEYMIWFTNDDLDADRLTVELSDDNGATWVTAEANGPTAGWEARTLDIAAHVALTNEVRVRFAATDNPNDSVTEGAVDAVRVVEYACSPGTAGDIDGDGDVDFEDLVALLSAWGPCVGCPADLDGSGTVDFSDLVSLLAAWT